MLHEAQGGTAFARAGHAGSVMAFANVATDRGTSATQQLGEERLHQTRVSRG